MRICSWLQISGVVAAALCARNAEAHIHLIAPASWTTEGAGGDPQKSAPCGGEGGAPTGIVTTFRPGQTVTVKWVETVYHPGHFRIAFATDRNQFADPMVTLDANQISVSAAIENPPVAPVLLDNLYPRTGNGTAGTMFQQDVVLPNITCAKCSLQVIQFMAAHGPPNYIYHHCADIQLSATAPLTDGGTTSGDGSTDDGSATAPPPRASGCSLAGAGAVGEAGWWGLALGLVPLLRRRRSSRV